MCTANQQSQQMQQAGVPADLQQQMSPQSVGNALVSAVTKPKRGK
jgi:hypothetical protein